MPLLDHFHPPLSQLRHWESFHAAWASTLADHLNEDLLPEGFFAEELLTVGGRIEIDVATMEESGSSNGSSALATKIWSPPAPSRTMPAIFPDAFAVQIFRSEGGPTLVAAIELISPGNKDRPAHRLALATKYAGYLYHGIGLFIVDFVTSPKANLHNEMITLLGQDAANRMADECYLYAVSYRPVQRAGQAEIDMWQKPLALGQTLPSMPLALDGEQGVTVDLESTYEDVCRRRIS